jgi:DNA-binding FadR family transcriptional regulator
VKRTRHREALRRARRRALGLRAAGRRLSEAVAARIRDHIVEHGLGEGDRLPTEHEMADQFGISRGSVREATKALEFLGILRSAPRRGLTVGRVDMQRVTEYLGFHFALNNYPREQLLKTRAVLERGALPGVIERMAADPAVYARLRGLADGLEGVSDVDAFIRGDAAFHRALLESSGIEPLVAFGDVLGIFFVRFRREVVDARQGWASGVRMHRELLDALRDGDLKKAERILDEHLQHYKGLP